ncbi:MXAN_6640 family putative metalloprotease [Nocardioides sp.]|uniref:MXAN_6640 family putative metalloprotease n=1 Tax=Nocardioides sp. TaxID=35761 RepID=UPI002EDA7307
MRLRRVLALAATAAVAVSLIGVPSQAQERTPAQDPGVRTDASSRVAARALVQAREVLWGDRRGDATLALRELRRHRDELSAGDRASADLLLARPTTGRTTCFTTVCVHWSATGAGRSTADYVQQVADTAEHVLETYAAAGYRGPEADGTRGGNGLLDIYLQDLGSQGLYGYCDSDREPPTDGPYDTWAYCAFDNDYAEFPSHTPLENLQVTAAHELFHAVQFAYDYYEDAWFMEATATWAEDELYDDVDDNLQYLPTSPLAQPRKAMDHFSSTGLRQYGDWIFFRYLTEHLTERAGGLPTFVRDVWELADGAKNGPDDYSIAAVDHALAARGENLRETWAAFAAANRRPRAAYDEGRANRYPSARPGVSVELSGSHRDTGWTTRRVDHLASITYRLTRAPRMAASRLRLRLDLPATARGSGAVVTIYREAGRTVTVPLRLSGSGDATRKVAFGRGVTRVEVTLANAGIDYKCWRQQDTGYSCRGRSEDDDLPMRLRATAVR